MIYELRNAEYVEVAESPALPWFTSDVLTRFAKESSRRLGADPGCAGYASGRGSNLDRLTERDAFLQRAQVRKGTGADYRSARLTL